MLADKSRLIDIDRILEIFNIVIMVKEGIVFTLDLTDEEWKIYEMFARELL